MGRIFPLLYWFGLVVTLVGIGLRFWLGWLRAGLVVALIGIAMLLLSRLVIALPRYKR